MVVVEIVVVVVVVVVVIVVVEVVVVVAVVVVVVVVVVVAAAAATAVDVVVTTIATIVICAETIFQKFIYSYIFRLDAPAVFSIRKAARRQPIAARVMRDVRRLWRTSMILFSSNY